MTVRTWPAPVARRWNCTANTCAFAAVRPSNRVSTVLATDPEVSVPALRLNDAW